MKTTIIAILIKILFVDAETKETLPAVKVVTNEHTYYSNLDGYVSIPNNEKIVSINYISYSDISNISLKNDTTITLH